MKPRRPPVTLEEHVALGRELFAMRERLGHLTTKLSHTRRVSARLVDRFLRTERDLDALRRALDDLLHVEHPAAARSGEEG